MKYFKFFILFLFPLTVLSCHDDDEDEIKTPTYKTTIMFMPWSTNLTPYFEQNIADIETVINDGLLRNERIIVCISSKPRLANVIELRPSQRGCVRDTLLQYEDPHFTKQEDITRMLVDVRRLAPASSYALIVGGHGMAWLPNGRRAKDLRDEFLPQTRWFGGLTSNYQIATTTLATAIKNAGMHMEYILFDDCYMSSVEVAYDLKDVTGKLIGCPTEIMIYGFPYHLCARHIFGAPDYAALCQSFINFYATYYTPCATIAVTDCGQIDALAEIVRRINMGEKSSSFDLSNVQPMDGYYPTLFYDLGDYINQICDDSSLLDEFNRQLAKTVPYKEYTEYYYSSLDGARHKINAYSGITTSVLNPSSESSDGLEETEWYQATH